MATTQNNEPPFVICENLVRIYKVAELEVFALQGLDIEVHGVCSISNHVTYGKPQAPEPVED